jgi:DNA helicase-4
VRQEYIAIIALCSIIVIVIAYKIISKYKFIRDVQDLIQEVDSCLGKFIEEDNEKRLLGKAKLYKEILVSKKYKFDEAVKFLTYEEELPTKIYFNNVTTLASAMSDYYNKYIEMVGNAEKFIVSPDIKPYADQFLEEAEQLASKSSRYIADSLVIQNFMKIYKNPKQYLVDLNYRYMENEKSICNELLSNIDGKSLDENQRNAVVNDDLRQLVIAGAGSGKTLTVAAKVKYLVERKGINPKDILLISFTRKAAGEMGERIRKLGIDVESSTFHKYGLSVIRNVNMKTPDVAEDIGKYIDRYLADIIYNDNELAKNFLILLGTLMLPVFDGDTSIGRRIQEEQCQDLTTIKGMYEAYSNKIKVDVLNDEIDNLDAKLAPLISRLEKLQDNKNKMLDGQQTDNEEVQQISEDIRLLETQIYKLRTQKLSIRNEKMKSAEEVMLANMFFLDGVEYEYEKEYPYDDEQNYRKKYRPDFYLIESDTYWEHFGIDENGNAKQYSVPAEREYLEGIEWKRNLHKESGTNLAETYSWQFRKNTISQAVNENYEKFGVTKHEVRYCDVIREILKGDASGNIESFKSLLSTFISLFKSYGYSKTKFDELRGVIGNYKDSLASKESIVRRKSRDQMFLDFAESFYDYYGQMLIEEEKIDFNDMILQAAGYIEQGAFKPNYKYVIIDEYQDISVGRYRLAKATLEQSNAKLFCVGDDWQSIYRFTGSEVDLLVSFENYFGLYSRTDIIQTYRNSQELLDISGAFVQQNEYQTPKKLKSNKHLENPIRIAWYTGSYRPILEEKEAEIEISFAQAFRLAVKEIVEACPNGEILLLGRNNGDIKALAEDKNLYIQREGGETTVVLSEYPDLKMRYLTVHRSKGLEADNVIILNARNSRSGFPNQIVDDPVLNLLRKNAENYPFAEERRLFYVAMTRTKNFTYIIAPITQSSRFVDDLKMLEQNTGASSVVDTYPEDNRVKLEMVIDPQRTKPLSCPVCKIGTLVKRKGKEGREFVSCSNYPSCTYKASNMDAVRNNNRCPVCDNFLIKRNGVNGEFMGCMSYPYCTYTSNIVIEVDRNKAEATINQSQRIDKYAKRIMYNAENGKPANSHVGWTIDEDHQLISEFNNGKSIKEMAAIHKRSSGGITARLKKLGLVER